MERGISTEHVQAVLAIDDRVLRNYWVTQTYSDLASGLAALLDPGTANWCTFGTWASCTVGRNLRGEELPAWLHQRVVLPNGMMGVTRTAIDSPAATKADRGYRGYGWTVPQNLDEAVRELFGACATNLSDGNTQVFAEIAPVAATFIGCFGSRPGDPSSGRGRVLAACDGAPEFEGSNRLRAGFALWCDALSEPDPTRRSQLILAGSLQLGAHEQHHLQEPIAGSMDMGLNQAGELLRQRLAEEEPGASTIAESIDKVLHPLEHVVSDLWGDLMTELLGTIETPDGTFRLDRDLPALPGQSFVPPDLEPVVVDDLARLLERFNRATPDGRGSRAIDWVDLDDRMNFISNLFRSRHHRRELFQPPFGPAVLAEIEAGRLPGPGPGQRGHGVLGDGPAGEVRVTSLVPPSRGVDMFTDAFVEQLRLTGDAEADAAVAEFFEATAAGHGELFRRLASSGRGPDDEDLPGIGPFVK